MFQIIDGTFEEASRYCIHDHRVVEEGGHFTKSDFRMKEDEAYQTLYQEDGGRATKDLAISILQGKSVGGSTTVNNVSSVTNTSGKAITVASGGGQTDVDMTHSTTPDATPDPTDLWMRQDALKNILTMSTTQLIAWLNGALSFLSSVPPNGPGTAVGQFCWQTIGVTAGHVPAYAGFSRGVTTATAAEMQNGQWPGVDQSRVKAWAGVNSADYGFSLANWYAESGFNEIAGAMAGTWLYVGCFETVSYAMWNQYVTLWLRLPD